jgi:hypothetical protein
MMDTERTVELVVQRQGFNLRPTGHIRPGKGAAVLAGTLPIIADGMMSHMALKHRKKGCGSGVMGLEF